MDSSPPDKKGRMNVECDRISQLPDDLIHKILSFLDIKQAMGTSALSSRWQYVWTSMPCLNFSSAKFHKLPDFSKFVTHVLSRRNNEIDVSSVKLHFRGKYTQVFVKRILDYAFSHKVQQLNVTRLDGKKMEVPFSLFNSQSLKHLTLNGSCYPNSILTPPIWDLPALTTLNLISVTLYDDSTDKCAGLFSNCANLKNLTLRTCGLMGSNDFNICHPGLSSLRLEDVRNGANVVTPQLKKLTIKYCRCELQISAPRLSFLHFEDSHYYRSMDLSADFLSLQKVDIHIPCYSIDKEDAHGIVSLLQQLHSVKFLTLNLEIIKTLSSFVELISHLPSPFTNLKRLKIYPAYVDPDEETQSEELTMCSKVKSYLLDGSLGATFTMVSYEEIRAVMNVASARKLMRELQVELNLLKENRETDKTDMDQDMTTVHEQVEAENGRAKPDTEVKWHFGERITRIESYWEDLNERLEKGYSDAAHIISMLREIEEVLTKLPTTPRAKLQARFSNLCAEAGTIMDNMMDHLKKQCDKKPRFKCLLS
ncbi:hypothetical protein SSX86_029536 [Deinandra increscens subsp. villosa]|uniref:F-box domain-containing protein n=1 Tax=Deinandra increscens subsp. villosa TaxID=3103831 RepID=A0AAP0GKM5_9ASTR